jgi:hypothetical protein
MKTLNLNLFVMVEPQTKMRAREGWDNHVCCQKMPQKKEGKTKQR